MTKHETFFVEQTYGLRRLPPRQSLVQYGQAILIVVGADGTVSDAEMAYLMGLGRLMGIPDDVREAWATFDWRHGRLEECVPGLSTDAENPGEISLAFLYDAIRVSRADGVYAEAEQRAVARAARTVGIPHGAVTALESLVQAEESLRSLRLSLLYPTKTRYQGNDDQPRFR